MHAARDTDHKLPALWATTMGERATRLASPRSRVPTKDEAMTDSERAQLSAYVCRDLLRAEGDIRALGLPKTADALRALTEAVAIACDVEVQG